MKHFFFVAEPLTVVKSKSSPAIVKSYKKFDVRLVCTFKGGDPPINITLTRRGRRLIDGVVVKGKILYGTIKTTHWAAFGSYHCIAVDSKGKKVKHKINLKKAGKTLLTELVILPEMVSRTLTVRLLLPRSTRKS